MRLLKDLRIIWTVDVEEKVVTAGTDLGILG